ncbi:adenylate/guanylate cyclase domain-containing protein [Marinicellulosiphila megalodicopiae]|uniref:adenylate/guanylate cyclase domain-containing protein n=1 Tax=Marinicellulosiphila megalodicopiae TaxID=2724896 RepID=UPI003BB04C8A
MRQKKSQLLHSESTQLFNQDSLFMPHTSQDRTRAFIYLTLCATILSAVYTNMLDKHFAWTIVFAVSYPLFANGVAWLAKAQWKHKVSVGLVWIDAFVIGCTVILLQATPMITLLLFIMANACFVLLGSIVHYLASLFFLVLGVMLIHGSFDMTYIEHAPDFVNVVCALGVGIYVTILTFINQRTSVSLEQTRKEMHIQKDKYKDVSNRLAKYLPTQVWQNIFDGSEAKLETQRKKLTIFFSDIKGFTDISDRLESEELTALLNNYLSDMAQIAQKYGGTIDKFIGDAVMIFFGDPESNGVTNDASAAVWMAIEMRKHMKVLRNRWRAQGIETPLEIRMGINTGFCTVGNFGTDSRMDYTIVGKQVNLASRLESLAGSGEIYIAHETYALIKNTVLCEDVGAIQIKGFSNPINVYKVVDYRHEVGAANSFSEFEYNGFSLQVDANNLDKQEKVKLLNALKSAQSIIERKI